MVNEKELRDFVEGAHEWSNWNHDRGDDPTAPDWVGTDSGRMWRVCSGCCTTHEALVWYESGEEEDDKFILPGGKRLTLQEASGLNCQALIRELRAIVESAHDWQPDDRDHPPERAGWDGPGGGHVWRVCGRCGLTHRHLLFPYERAGRIEWEDDFILPNGGVILGVAGGSELECSENGEVGA
jgi:hypothetical protein